MKVTAKATRSGDWWAVVVPEVEGVFTQVKRLDQVAAMAADAVGVMLDIAPDSVEVVVLPMLGAVQRDVDEATEAAQAATAAQARASALLRSVVTTLRRDQSLSTRDVATILGISHQRVSQLDSSPSAAAADERKSSTRGHVKVAAAHHASRAIVTQRSAP